MSNVPPPTTSIDTIKGNACEATKELLSNPALFFQGRPKPDALPVSGDDIAVRYYSTHPPPRILPVFGEDILRRLIVTEVSISNKQEDQRKKEAIVIFELDVTEG
jgi:hypothetical protein